MSPGLGSLGFDTLVLLAGGVALLVAMRVVGWVLGLLPVSRERHEMIARASPVAAALAGLVYLLFAARALFADYPAYVPAVLGLVVAAFVAASWSAIRDFSSGVVLKAGRICKVGDTVRIGQVQGRVERLGLRVLVMETSAGEEAIIPYSQVVRESVLRAPVIDGVALHVFRLPVPPGLPLREAKDRAREAALLNHWASIVREPEIVLTDGDRLEVTVFALHPDHAPDVEAAVRQALGQGRASGSS